MIVVVMGMSKSGTTLVSKTLHESGIDMNPDGLGSYARTKYECPGAIEILKEMVGCETLQSLYLPEQINFDKKTGFKMRKYIIDRNNKCKDWGFKQPWLTLCYDRWKEWLPDHIAIGVRRNPKGLIAHYYKNAMKKKRPFTEVDRIIDVQRYYNDRMKGYGIPIVDYGDILNNGPSVIEKIVGRKLKDVRDGRKHIC